MFRILRHDSLRRRVTAAGIAVLAVAGSTAVVLPVTVQPASAAFAGLPFQTNFEIDGNTAAQAVVPPAGGAGIDWDNAPSYLKSISTPTDFCGNGVDPTTVSGKLDNFNPFAPNPTPDQVLNKGDLCQAYVGWQAVRVTADPVTGVAFPNGGSRIEYVLYGGWRRAPVAGEISLFIPLIPAGSTSKSDVILIEFDYNSAAGGGTSLVQRKWNGTTWAIVPFNPGTAQNSAVNANQSPSFGEFAVNLTATGVLSANPVACKTLTSGYVFTQTGNSDQAELKDYVGVTPIAISNCTDMTVTKQTTPSAPSPAATFDVNVSQVDVQPIQPSNPANDLDAALTNYRVRATVPGTPSQTVTSVIASPDYLVREVAPAAPWSLQSIVCNAYTLANDALTAVPTGPLPLTNPDGTYNSTLLQLVPPAYLPPAANGIAASCTVQNRAPSLTLVKNVVNATRAVTATPDMWLLSATPTPSGSATSFGPGTSTGVTRLLTPGTYVLGETRNTSPAPPANDYTDGTTWTCATSATDATPFPVTSGNRVTLTASTNPVCTIANTAKPAQLTLVKQLVNTGGGTASVNDFTLAATFTTPGDTGIVDGGGAISGVSGSPAVTNRGVKRGVYTLSETSLPGYAASWQCVNGLGTVVSTTPSISIPNTSTDATNRDLAITCTVTNTYTPLNIRISGTAVNPVGQPHTFTLTATKTVGAAEQPLPGATLNLSLTPSAGLGGVTVLANTCDATPGPGVGDTGTGTDASGQCVVTVTSPTSGVLTISASGFSSSGPAGVPQNAAFTLANPVTSSKRWRSYAVTGQASAINLAGQPHQFVLTGTQVAGTNPDGSPNDGPLQQGAVINFTWSGSGTPVSNPAGSNASSCTVTSAGTCTVTVGSSEAGSGTLQVTSVVVDLPNGQTAVSTTSYTVAVTTTPLVKDWVRFRALVSASAVNPSGQPHPFVVTLQQTFDGTNWSNVPDGALVSYSWAGAGTPSPLVCGPTVNGQCTINVSNPGFGQGTFTVMGIQTVTVNRTNPTRTQTYTNLTAASNPNAVTLPASVTKTWVQLGLSIQPLTANNLSTEAHTWTVQVTAFDGDGPFVDGAGVPGAVVTGKIVSRTGGAPTALTGTCATGASSNGQCTLIATPTGPGTMSVQIDNVQATVDGQPFNLTVAVPPPNGLRTDLTLPDVTGSKVWWQYRVRLDGDSVNPYGQPHDFVATVERTNGDGTWLPVQGATLTSTWTDTADPDVSSVTANTCATLPGTDANGRCTITVTSPTPTVGTLTVTGIAGVPLDRDGNGSIDPTGDEYPPVAASALAPSSVLSNTKTWQAASITLRKQTVGGTGTFTLQAASTTGGPTFTTSPALDTSVANPAQQTFSLVPTGTYRFSEAPNAAFRATTLQCVVGATTYNQQSGPSGLYVEFPLVIPQSAVCTASNERLSSVSVRKLTAPSNLPISFTFDLRQGSPTGTVLQTASDSAADLVATPFPSEIPAGTYAVTERINGGFIPGLGTCVRPAVTNDTPVSADSLVVGPGEAWVCTFTNVQRGSIRIAKQTVGPDTTQQFTFNRPASLGGGTFPLGSGDSQLFSNVAPGAYDFSEVVPSGWALTNLVCSESGGTNGTPTTPPGVSGGVVTPPGVTVNVDPGEDVVCTFTNTQLGSITIEKVARPVGTGTTFDFTSTQLGPFSLVNGASGTDSKPFPNLLPGTFVVTETPDASGDWVRTGLTCVDSSGGTTTSGGTATIGLAAGDAVTCTYTNTKQATIQVAKVTQRPGDPADQDISTGFRFTGAISATLAGGQSSTPVRVAPDPATPYVVTEAVPSNWALTTIVCTDLATGQAATTATGNVGSAAASFSPTPGQRLLCTFTNEQGAIVVTKATVPNPSAELFPFLVSGPAGSVTGPDGAPVTTRAFDVAGGGSQLVYVRPGGPYTVSETVPAGWKLSANTCSAQTPAGATGTASPGANTTVTCAYTNTQLGGVTVTKSVTGAQATDAWSFDFTISPAPPAPQTATQTVSGTGTATAAVTWTDLDPDTTYTITEAPKPGTSPFLTGQIACGGSPAPGTPGVRVQPTPGSTVTPVACTATNVRTGSITVVKQLVGGRVLTTGDTFDVVVSNGPADVSLAVNDLGDGGSQALPNLQPSSFMAATGALDGPPVPYRVTEQDPADPRYRLLSVTCVAGTTVKYTNVGGPFLDPSTVQAQVDLLAGEDVTCTFTNDFVDLRITKADSADPVVPGQGALSYTISVTNLGTGRPSGDATVVDTLASFPAEVVFTGTPPSGCSYTSPRLATCTIPADQLDPTETATIVLPVSVPATTSVAAGGAPFDNRASVDVPDDPCGASPCTPPPTCPPPAQFGNNAVCEPTTLTPQADLALQKLATGPGGTTPNDAQTPATAEGIVPGQPVTFTLQVTNNGPSVAQGLTVTDPLATDLVAPVLFVSASPGFACDRAGGGTAAAGEPLSVPVTCRAATLAVGATASIVFSATAADPVTAAAPFPNTATVSGRTTDPVPGNDSDVAYLKTFDLAVTKVFRDGKDTTPAVAGGAPFTYAVTVTNLGSGAAVGNATVTDRLPTGFLFDATPLDTAASSAGVTCGTPTGQPPSITCTVPAALLPAGGSAKVVLRAKAAPSVPANPSGLANQNLAVVSHPDDPPPADPVCVVPDQVVARALVGSPSNNVACAPTPVVAAADLGIDKQVDGVEGNPDPLPVRGGQTITYTLTVTNAGPSDSTGVVVSDPLPAAFTQVAPGTASGLACTLTPPGAQFVLSCSTEVLAAGATASVTLTAVVPTGLADGTVLTNTATVSSKTPQDPDVLPNSDSASVKLGAATVTVVKDAKGQAGSFSYTLSGQPASTPIADGGRFTWPPLVPGTFTLAEQPTAGFRQASVTCVNLATEGSAVSTGTSGPVELVLAAGDRVVCTFVNETFDLSIDKDDGGVTAVAGGAPFTYTLTVRNLGTGAAVGDATVVDDLPAGLVWTGTQPSGCSVSGQQLTCTIPAASLGAGAVVTRTVSVSAPAPTAPGTYTNAVRVTHPDDTGNPLGNPANNTDTETTPVVAQVDLGIVKDVASQRVLPGGTATYTITVTNFGPSTATAVVVTDTMPAGLTPVSMTSTFFTCTVSTSTCTAPSLAPGQSASITVVGAIAATGLTDGQSLRNVATVSSAVSDPEPNPTPNTDDAVITVVVPELPATGADPSRPVVFGAGLVFLGFGAILLSRRRRRAA